MRGWRAFPVWVAIAACGCAASPPRRIFVLSEPQAAGGGVPVKPTLGPIQLQNVTVPDYLDVDDILVRSDRYQLQPIASAQWGERLSGGVTHALTAMLAERLPEYAWEPARPVEKGAIQILVDVRAFDLWADGRCVLSASWRILERETGTTRTSDRTRISIAASGEVARLGDSAEVVGAADAVARLAD